jgi:hypothetical protein
MNAPEFEELVNRAISRAVKEGVAEDKLDFIYMIGILERKKQMILDWQRDVERDIQKANAPRIVKPGG